MATYFTGNGIPAADNAARSTATMVAASNCYENNGGGGCGDGGGSLVY